MTTIFNIIVRILKKVFKCWTCDFACRTKNDLTKSHIKSIKLRVLEGSLQNCNTVLDSIPYTGIQAQIINAFINVKQQKNLQHLNQC